LGAWGLGRLGAWALGGLGASLINDHWALNNGRGSPRCPPIHNSRITTHESRLTTHDSQPTILHPRSSILDRPASPPCFNAFRP
jgi:hypothetical protein